MSPVRTAIFKAFRRSEDLDIPVDPKMVFYARLWEKNAPIFISSDVFAQLMSKTGAIWRPNGYYFDGTDDLFNLGNIELFNFGTSDFTIECIYYRTGGVEGAEPFSKSGGSGIGASPAYDLQPLYDRWFIQKDATHWTLIYATYPCATLNKWLHVICDRQDATLTLMVNGVLSNNAPTTSLGGIGTGLNITNTYNAKIGANDYSYTAWYKGIISEVIVYKRVLSYAEKINHYVGARKRCPWLQF